MWEKRQNDIFRKKQAYYNAAIKYGGYTAKAWTPLLFLVTQYAAKEDYFECHCICCALNQMRVRMLLPVPIEYDETAIDQFEKDTDFYNRFEVLELVEGIEALSEVIQEWVEYLLNGVEPSHSLKKENTISPDLNTIPIRHDEIMNYLLNIFKKDRDHLLTKAASDDTKRHELIFVLDYENINDTRMYFGGTVSYNKKLRKFTHINYTDKHNWVVQFSIETKIAYFAYEFWKPLRKIQPFWSMKKLTNYLLTH